MLPVKTIIAAVDKILSCYEGQVTEHTPDTDFLRVDKNGTDRYRPGMPVSAFGQNIKRLRLAKQPPLRAKELARLIETDPAVISRWEQGKAGLPETPTLLRLAKNLEVSVDQLLDGVDDAYDALRRDLPDHGLKGSSVAHGQKGAAGETASPRVLEGRPQDRAAALIKALTHVAQTATIALLRAGVRVPAQDADARTAQPGRRGGRRGAR